MKKSSILILTFFILMAAGCRSSGTYRVTFDPSVNDQFAQATWIAYTSPIRNNMFQYYKKNPNGNYTVPYDVEINARNSLIYSYLRMQRDYEIHDDYIEDVIKILDSYKLDEYVFFSFNPGNWSNDRNFEKDAYMNWMQENMPDHVPLTPVRVERVE
jgi:hypothetical protein